MYSFCDRSIRLADELEFIFEECPDYWKGFHYAIRSVDCTNDHQDDVDQSNVSKGINSGYHHEDVQNDGKEDSKYEDAKTLSQMIS